MLCLISCFHVKTLINFVFESCWPLSSLSRGNQESTTICLRGLSFCGNLISKAVWAKVWRNQSIKRSFIWLLMNWKVRSKYAGSRICMCSWLHRGRGKEAPSRFALCFPPPNDDVSYSDGCRKNELQPKLLYKITLREVASNDELSPLCKLAECCWSNSTRVTLLTKTFQYLCLDRNQSHT